MEAPGDPHGDARHRLLVLANETCGGSALFDAIRERLDGENGEVLIVAPALSSRLHYWMSDEDPGREEAERRLAASVEHCKEAGIPAKGALGDADPLQALDDAVRTFDPDQVLIVTHPAEGENWLEHGLVTQARERFPMPIGHVEVDAATETARVVDREPARRDAPARERHARRDWMIVIIAWLLAIGGTVITGLLTLTDAPGWLLGTWFLVFDLGFKIAAFVVTWIIFQRRARADRLDI
jgi:hypothetical protein